MAKKESFSYFGFFREMIALACEAAHELDELVGTFDRDQLTKRSRALRDIEHRADSLKHNMLEQLLKEFLPPIDREDIMRVASRLDDIVDAIDDAAHCLQMFDITTCRPETKSFTELIVRCCECLTKVIDDFEGYKKKAESLRAGVIEVNSLEGEGDKLYTEAIHALFTDGTDAVQVCAWKDIFDYLEACCDACEHVADQVDTVLMKNY
ncbi:MAG: DUF47 family protein [Ruminococcaceae bacterium]|nr:DUF47 family protein [Oscillospiraceae bacterium]